MPAKIKKGELSQLLFLSKIPKNAGAFYGYMDALLMRHGCSIKTHYINERGWITERMGK